MIWMLAIWMAALEVGQAREQQFPYVAFVTAPDVYVRSGPGQKYYPTQQLAEGFAVEVYRHDGAGWCAIRPPEGSFSWIPAHQIRVVSQAVGEVAGENVVTRIGSELSPARSTVQVLLPKGERVQFLGGQPTDNPGWLRVAAPAGEFRWIAAKYLSLQPPIESASPVPSSSGGTNNSPLNAVLVTSANQPTTAFQHLQDSRAGLPGSNSFQPPVGATESKPMGSSNSATRMNQDPNAIDVVAGSPAEMQLAQFQPKAAGLVSPPRLESPSTSPTMPSYLGPNHLETTASHAPFSSSPRIRFRNLSASDSSAVERLAELRLRLSQIVIQRPEEWHFGQLESEANGLLARTESPQVRSELRNLLDRIARFHQIRQGYEGGTIARSSSLADAELPTKPEGDGLTGLTSKVRELAKADLTATRIATTTTETPSPSVDQPLYDAVGLLKPVASKRAKAPQYALVDDNGEVVSFVTPTPDLNLKAYLGRRIGVHGKRGFMPEYRRAHVTAERISPIVDQIRR